MISTKGRYALRVMIDIAMYSNGNYVSLKDTSKREDISFKYLEQVIVLLTKGGLLQSLRGNNGGYKLAKDPKNITAGDILRLAEGTLAPVQCLKCDINVCERSSRCSTIDFWKEFNDKIVSFVDSITLEDLVNKYKDKTQFDYSI